MEVYDNLSIVVCDLLKFLFWLPRHLQVCRERWKPGTAVKLAVEADLHIWVNFLNAGPDLKSQGNSILQRAFSYCFHFHLDGRFERALACSRTSITALLQRGIWRKIMLFIRGMGLYNCCSFDLASGSELECERFGRHLHPVALSAICYSLSTVVYVKGNLPSVLLWMTKEKKWSSLAFGESGRIQNLTTQALAAGYKQLCLNEII